MSNEMIDEFFKSLTFLDMTLLFLSSWVGTGWFLFVLLVLYREKAGV